jgi:hypothetical protein
MFDETGMSVAAASAAASIVLVIVLAWWILRQLRSERPGPRVRRRVVDVVRRIPVLRRRLPAPPAERSSARRPPMAVETPRGDRWAVEVLGADADAVAAALRGVWLEECRKLHQLGEQLRELQVVSVTLTGPAGANVGEVALSDGRRLLLTKCDRRRLMRIAMSVRDRAAVRVVRIDGAPDDITVVFDVRTDGGDWVVGTCAGHVTLT